MYLEMFIHYCFRKLIKSKFQSDFKARQWLDLNISSLPKHSFKSVSNLSKMVSRQLDAENWTRENWSPQPGRATI
jgi:hypothetical protein